MAALLFAGLLVFQPVQYTADDTYQAIRQASAATGVSEGWLANIVGCETGWTYDPYSIGDHGTSFGAVQLHRGGLLEEYYATGHRDPYDPFEAVLYLAESLKRGRASAWTCA